MGGIIWDCLTSCKHRNRAVHEARNSKESSHSGEKLLFLTGEIPTAVVLITAWRAGLVPGLALFAFFAHPQAWKNMLGHTCWNVAVETVERHYAPFVPALRERVRRIMENGEGLEKTAVTNWGQSPAAARKPN